MKLVSKGDRHLLWKSGTCALFMYRGMTETLAFLMSQEDFIYPESEQFRLLDERTNFLHIAPEYGLDGPVFIIGHSHLPVSTQEQWEIHEQHFPIDITMDLLPDPKDTSSDGDEWHDILFVPDPYAYVKNIARMMGSPVP